MSISKTDLDIHREDEADKLNDWLPSSMYIAAGGRKGPYSLIVHRLNRKDVERIARVVAKELGWKLPRERP
jgi:hypothetical protein